MHRRGAEKAEGIIDAFLSVLSASAVTVLALLAASTCAAQTATNVPVVPPGVEVRIQAEPQKATIGDPLRIDLDVTLPKGYEVRLPQLGTQEGDFAILKVLPGPTIPVSTAQGKSTAPPGPQTAEPAHHHAQITVAAYKTGEVLFPSLQLTLRDPSGKETALPTPPVKVVIQSVLTEKDQNLNDLKRQAEMPEPSRWLLWLALGLLGLTLLGLAWWFYHRRSRNAAAPLTGPQLDPLQLAEAELRDLLGRGLIEKRLFKQFYVALSEIVKRIIEAGYGIDAIEKTTEEILEKLRAESSPRVPAEELESIEAFWEACDLVKFAKCIPSPAESDGAVKSAYRVLSLCRERRAASAALSVTTARPGGDA